MFVCLFRSLIKNKKSAQRGSFWDAYPADIRGSFARISRPNTSVRALEMLEKNKHLGADIHDPKARTSMTPRDFQKLRSEKLWAEIPFPRKRKHTPPCSSAELFFAEKKWGPLHHRPGKIFFEARKVLQKIFFGWWSCTLFFLSVLCLGNCVKGR